MASDESHDLNQQKPEGGGSNDPKPTQRKWFSWWYVWIPVIVAVTLWIGGWWFGNYGGPWGSKPRNVQPKISDPAVATIRSFESSGVMAQGTCTLSDFSFPS